MNTTKVSEHAPDPFSGEHYFKWYCENCEVESLTEFGSRDSAEEAGQNHACPPSGDRYIVIEVPAEAPVAEFEKVAEEVLGHLQDMNDNPDWTVDLFGFVPHAHQEAVLQELFGPGDD